MAAREKHPLRWLLLLGGLVVVATVLFLRTQVAWDGACSLLRRNLPEATGLEVGIEACEIDPLTQTLTLRGLSARKRGAPEPLLEADEAEVALRAVRLSGRVDLERVALKRPRVNLDLRQPSGSGGEGGCPLEALEELRIHELDVREARVRALLPENRQVDLHDLELGWEQKRGAAEWRLDARRGAVRLGERELLLAKLSGEGVLDVDDELLEVTRGELSLDEATLNVSGKVESLCEPLLSLEARLFLPMATVARAAGVEEKVGGSVWSRVTLSGRPDSATAKVQLSGSDVSWGPYSPGDFSAQLAYGGEELAISRLAVSAGAGQVRASGVLKLTQELPLELKVEADNAQFARILEKASVPGSWVDFPGWVKGRFSGPLLPSPNLTGELEARTGRFVLATRAFDEPEERGQELLTFAQARVSSRVSVHGDRVEFSGAQVDTGGTKVSGNVALYFDPSRGLSVHAEAERVELGDFGHIAGLAWAGRGAAQVAVSGPYRDVSVEATMSLRDFVLWDHSLGVVQGRVDYRGDTLAFPGLTGQKGKTQYHGDVQLRFGKEMRVLATVEMPRGRTEDVIDVIARLHPSIEAFQGTVTGEASGSLRFDSPVSRFAGKVSLDLRNTRYYGRRLGDGAMTLRFVDGEAMVLDKTVLQGPLGIASVEGRWAFDGPLDYRFRFDQVSMAELLGPEHAERLGISGTLTVAGKVDGDSQTPVVTAYLTAPKLTFGGKSIGRAHLEGRMQGRELHLWGRPFDDGRLDLELRVAEPYPYQATLHLALPEIRPLLPEGAISQGLSGSLAGTVTAAGNLRDGRSVKASAQLTKLTLARGDFAGKNDRPISLSYEGGRLQVGSFGFRGPNTELTAQGYWGPQTTGFGVHGTFDVRLIESFVPALERTAGRVELTVAVSGPVKDPSIVGRLELSDAKLSVRDQPVNVRALSGQVEFSEARVLVQELVGVLNDGALRVRGDVRLSDLAVKQLELGIELADASFRPLEDLPVVANATLLLYGKPGALQLSGGVDVVKLRYEKPLVLDALLKDARRVRTFGGGADKPKEWLRFDVDVEARGDVRVDNNLARAKLLGKLKLTGTNVRPGLVGTLESADGSQAFFRGNTFAIDKGELQFKDTSSTDAFVDFDAQTQVREYLVRVKAFGRLSEPKVILTSEPALNEADILSLLTLGVTSRDQGVSSQAGYGLAAEAFLSASGMDRQVQRFLPNNAVLRDVQVHLSTTLNPASGQVEPAWSLESKILTEQLTLKVTQPVSGRGRSAQAEYRFNDRLSARAQWDDENQDYSFGNPGLDLKLRFEWE